jgi:hypothetical protein
VCTLVNAEMAAKSMLDVTSIAQWRAAAQCQRDNRIRGWGALYGLPGTVKALAGEGGI